MKPLVLALLVTLPLAGCYHYDYCPITYSSTDTNTPEEDAFFQICDTRFEFRVDDSAFHVVSVTENRVVEWERYYIHDGNGGVHYRVNGPANASSSPVEYTDLDELFPAQPVVGDLIAMCGRSPAYMLVGRDEWVGSVDGPTVEIRACGPETADAASLPSSAAGGRAGSPPGALAWHLDAGLAGASA